MQQATNYRREEMEVRKEGPEIKIPRYYEHNFKDNDNRQIDENLP